MICSHLSQKWDCCLKNSPLHLPTHFARKGIMGCSSPALCTMWFFFHLRGHRASISVALQEVTSILSLLKSFSPEFADISLILQALLTSQHQIGTGPSVPGMWLRAKHHHQHPLWDAGARLEHHHQPLQMFQGRSCVNIPCYSQYMRNLGFAQKMQSSSAGKKQVLHQDRKRKTTHVFSGKSQKKTPNISLYFRAVTWKLLTRKFLGHLDWSRQLTMTFNRQHLTVAKPFAALGEIMITREKSYYCHHAFIMQMILR